jgi:atypical dual specificity phosphatase
MSDVLAFDFVDENEVRRVLEDYYDQACNAARARSYLGAVVGCGAVAEGVLTWALKRNASRAMVALTTILARDKRRKNKPRPHDRIENWSLDILVEVAKELGLLNDDVKQTCTAIRDYRNLVHPYRRVNGSPRFDASLEQSAFRAIERIVQALGGTASPSPFSEVEMNFCWVIERSLAGCRGPDTPEALKYLWTQGVRALVRLVERTKARVTVEQIHEFGFVDRHVPVRDLGVPTRKQLNEVLDFIDSMLRQKKPVAVSCGAGYGRTGTVLACFRVQKGSSAEGALEWLKQVRPGSAKEILELCPNQHKFISDFYLDARR